MREMFEAEYLPQCLALGITRAEYEELNIRKLRPYILADEIRLDRFNRDAHLQGRYFFDALSIALSNSFRGKGKKPMDYMNEPYDLRGARTKQKEHEAQLLKEEQMKAQFMQFAEKVRNRLGENNGN